MPFVIKPSQTLLFIGDSITDTGRRAAEAPLGCGYVRQIRDLMVAKYPAHQIKVINTGIGGNTTVELTDRWTEDCINHQPHWISIKIGINDIHRWLRAFEGQSTGPDDFALLYDRLLTRIQKETKAKVILVDPFYISTDRHEDSFRSQVLKHLPQYLKAINTLAKKYQTRHVKTHRVYQTLLERYEADQFCAEPVHPNPSGHLVIAHAWLKAMGW